MNASVIQITPSIAADLLMSCSTDFQRPVSQSVVNKYASDMSAGMWQNGAGGPIEIVKNGVAQWVINGQHRLHAVVKAGVPVEFVVITHHGTRDDAARMYQVYDAQKKRRFRDVYKIDGETSEGVEQLGSAVKIIIKMSAGLSAGGSGGRDVTTSEIIKCVPEWAPHYKRWREIRSDYDFVKKFDNAPTIAAAIYTLRYAPDMAAVFWGGVVTGDCNPNTGERKLREYALSTLAAAGGGGTTQVIRLRACSICWNASAEGREIKQLKLGRKDYRITFAGTPLE